MKLSPSSLKPHLKKPSKPSRKQLLLGLVSVLLVAALVGAAAWFFYYKDRDKSSSQAAVKSACELFPAEKANKFLNQSAEQQADKKLQAVAPDVSASKCVYTQKTAVAGMKYTATFSVQSPTNEASKVAVKQAFEKARPETALDQTYGDAGYWNMSNLHILKNGSWYTIRYIDEDTEEAGGEARVGDAQDIADFTISNL